MRHGLSGTRLAGAMPLRVLLVDDNVHFLDAARGLLDGDGMTVIGTATTSAEGLRLAAELQPDVTLVDIDLGDESGFDVVRRLKAADSANTQLVILTSAYSEEDFTELIQPARPSRFVPKSDLSPGAILELIRRHRIDRDPDAT